MDKRLATTLHALDVLPKNACVTLSGYLRWNGIFAIITSSKSLLEHFWQAQFSDALMYTVYVCQLLRQAIAVHPLAGKLKDSRGFVFGTPTSGPQTPSYLDETELGVISIPPPNLKLEEFPLHKWQFHPATIHKVGNRSAHRTRLSIPASYLTKKWSKMLSKPHEIVDGRFLKQISMYKHADTTSFDIDKWLMVVEDTDVSLWTPLADVGHDDKVLICCATHEKLTQVYSTCKYDTPVLAGSYAMIVPVSDLPDIQLWNPSLVEKPISETLVRRRVIIPEAPTKTLTPVVATHTDAFVFDLTPGQWYLIVAFIILLVATWIALVLSHP